MIYNPDVLFSNKKREIVGVINDLIYLNDFTISKLNQYIENMRHTWNATERHFAKSYVRKIQDMIEKENGNE